VSKARVAHVLAVWFGCGHVPRAPGLAGTLGAIPLYLLVRPFGLGAVAVTAALVTVVGVWASGVMEKKLARKDPQIVCIDEVAGVFVTWLAVPSTWVGLLAGVALFRLFDQFKPWPARLCERRLRGGPGIMGDDVVAGLWGCVVLLVVRRLGLL
jgi:phosphatidylglycerophosphatase A